MLSFLHLCFFTRAPFCSDYDDDGRLASSSLEINVGNLIKVDFYEEHQSLLWGECNGRRGKVDSTVVRRLNPDELAKLVAAGTIPPP